MARKDPPMVVRSVVVCCIMYHLACASPERGPRSARYFDVPLRSGPATPPNDQCAPSEGSTRSTTPNMREGSHGSPRKRHALISTCASERSYAPHDTLISHSGAAPPPHQKINVHRVRAPPALQPLTCGRGATAHPETKCAHLDLWV